MPTQKPFLFIGSASESREIVTALEAELRSVARIERWDLDTFRPGHFILEELAEKTAGVDFAVFVLGREDSLQSRGEIVSSPRDNVVFEAGLFTAVLGRERTFYVVDRRGTKIPTDWGGLTYLTFDVAAERGHDKVFEAAEAIRERILKMRTLDRSGRCGPLLGHWWQFVENLTDGAVLSLMEIRGADARAELVRIKGRSWSKGGALLAEYRSRSADFEEESRSLSYYWAGEHPRTIARPEFFGVGEIVFEVPNGGPGEEARTASGFYSSSSRADLHATELRSTRYERASADEVQVMDSKVSEDRAALIQRKLLELNQMSV